VRFRKSAWFDRAQVSGLAFFGPSLHRNAVFDGEVRFVQTTFAGTASFRGAQFRGYANFYGLRVQGDLYMAPSKWGEVRFEQGIMLASAIINGVADLSGATFGGPALVPPPGGGAGPKDSERVVATFTRSQFLGGIHLATQSLFCSTQFHCDAFFTDVRVSGLADFSNVQFHGQANFVRSEFAGEARFEAPLVGVNFGFKPDFTSCHFKAKGNFSMAIMQGGADFAAARFDEDAIFDAADFRGPADFTSVEVKYHASFIGAVFQDASFSEARINVMHCYDPDYGLVRHAKFNQALDLRGFTYTRIYADWQRLLSENQMQTYDRQPFTQMESALRSVGQDQTADARIFRAQTA
jgi:uncharacterized protein YjbI with pentapeptide repeats